MVAISGPAIFSEEQQSDVTDRVGQVFSKYLGITIGLSTLCIILTYCLLLFCANYTIASPIRELTEAIKNLKNLIKIKKDDKGQRKKLDEIGELKTQITDKFLNLQDADVDEIKKRFFLTGITKPRS